MHLSEHDMRFASNDQRDRLFEDWRPYFDLSKPYMLEKSPRHSIMTRLLQYYFTPPRTYFIALIKHPLATMREVWDSKPWTRVASNFTEDCGEQALEHCASFQFI